MDYFKDPELRQRYRHAWRHSHLGKPGRHTEDRGDRPAQQEAHGNVRRGSHRPRPALHGRTAKKADKPFFLWFNSTRMHIWTHLKQESAGQDGPWHLSRRDGRARRSRRRRCLTSSSSSASTTTPSSCTPPTTAPRSSRWPDGGAIAIPRREKHQLGGRLPCADRMRWPGVIKPGTVFNDILAHEDMLPTLLAAAGEPDVKEKLKQGHEGRQQDLQGASRRLQYH